MIINHNLNAMNAHRQMGINIGQTGKATEKLSSGLRINRAGDDAAGLAISEKMRAQVRGLNQASRNAQDGISLIQTAEGALTESHSILQRMRELAVQSANDTNVAVDRGEIQKEIDQLSQELTRISDTTEFNTQKLLEGSFKGKFHIGANAGQDITLEIGNMSAEKLGVQGKVYEATDVSGVTGLEVASTTGKALTVKIAAAKGSNSAAITETKAELNTAGTEINITLKQDAGATNTAGAVTATNDEIKAALEKIAGDAGIKVSTKDTFNGAGAATGAAGKNTTVSIVELTEESKKSGIDVSSQKAASTAITTINSAIEKVSAERSKLGAYQNRLEHTIANLDNSSENLQAAESRVRDVDMAKEMMNFSKSNILQQAAQAMLAQANQAPQGVLQLLR
ncbi:flagellin [Clostridium cochlearium]|uniref:flagellin N-terminal helical domain-containing protein n=1 Tax=Clostridium cochlearium TaxID=1494 RepID=UPI001EDE7305|nr:flagellin [Clostridium cochlearium]MCG4571623.1 flagellin [Clostridium cochlearium]MCG4580685.1 flagellin [Clostridium cochlearium]